MKIIKTSANHSNIFLIFIITCCIISCKKNVMEKNENLGLKGSINNIQSQKLKLNKWKLRRYKIVDQMTGKIIYQIDISDKIITFNQKNILTNNKISGTINYKANSLIINNIDTLTNKFYLLHMRNDQLILRNDVSYYVQKEQIKKFKIELDLSTDTIKSNTILYKIGY